MEKRVKRGGSIASWVAAALLLAGSSPAGTSPQSPSSDGVQPGSPRSDLVMLADGVFSIDVFERCEPFAATGAGQRGASPAGPMTTQKSGLQLLIHSEARADQISRDRFVARTARRVTRELAELAADKRIPSPASLLCSEIGAPDGDVDFEIALRVKPDGVEILSLAKVEGQTLMRSMSARQGAGRCVQDAAGAHYCAASPDGTAVKSPLGQIVCARGQCVRTALGEWRCARAAGGWAEMNTAGRPQCENGCYTPSTTQCQRMR